LYGEIPTIESSATYSKGKKHVSRHTCGEEKHSWEKEKNTNACFFVFHKFAISYNDTTVQITSFKIEQKWLRIVLVFSLGTKY